MSECPFVDDVSLYIKNFKKSTQKTIRTNKKSSARRQDVRAINKLYFYRLAMNNLKRKLRK